MSSSSYLHLAAVCADTELAAATPSIPAKKQRQPSNDKANVPPNNTSTTGRHDKIAEVRPTTDTQLIRAETASPSAAATPAPAAKGIKRTAAMAHTSAAPAATDTPAAAAKVSRTATVALDAAAVSATAALLTPAAVCKDTTRGLGSSSAGTTSASAKVLQSPGSYLKTPAGQTLKIRQVRTLSCTVDAATPRLATAAPATLNPKNLLSEVFSPSPVPTPMLCARLAFKTPRSTVTPNVLSSAVPEAGSNVTTVTAAGPSNSSNRAAMSGTPLPRPHFTPRSMPPPARRVSGSGAGFTMQQQQQTLGGSALAAAVEVACNVSSSSKDLESPIGIAGSLINCSKELAAITPVAVAAEEDYTGHDLANKADQQHTTAAAAASVISIDDSVAGSQSPLGVWANDMGRCSKLPAPALVQVASAATAAAVADPIAHWANSSQTVSTAAGADSKTCLPAKLRCKRASFSNAPAAAVDMHAAAVVDDKLGQLEQHQQRLDGGTADAAARACPAAEGLVTAADGTVLRTPTTSRLGLKRRWCQDHAAAMAAEAAAAAVTEPPGSLARSPDSTAVARAADLLLAAAAAADDLDWNELEHRGEDPCLRQQSVDNTAAVTAMILDFEPPEQQIRHRRLREVYNALAAAAAATDEIAPRKHANRGQQALQGHQQQQMLRSKDRAMLDFSNVVTADHAVLGSSCGTSLLLPAAAQARLQQKIPKPSMQAGTAIQHTATAAEVTAAVLASAQCSQFSQQHQQPMPLQQFQLQQQQILAAAAAAGVRVQHSTTAAYSAVARVMHSGAVMPQPGPVMHRTTAGAARYGVWNGHLVLLQAHQQQESVHNRQSPDMQVAEAGAAFGTRTASPEVLRPAAGNTNVTAVQLFSPQSAVNQRQIHPPGAQAAGSTAMGAANTVSSSKNGGATVNSKDLAVTPLSVPGTLSDDEAWKLAQAQPWVIELEAARARQLLAHTAVIAAAAAAGNT